MKTLTIITLLIYTLSSNVFSQTVADFSSDVTQGCTSVEVNYENNSSPGEAGTYHWDFGNGQSSTLFEPTVVYSFPGTYNVTLTASYAGDTDILLIENFITVFSSPEVNIGVENESTGCVPLYVQFRDESIPAEGKIISWYWDFGDGITSTEQNPGNIYTHAGDYSVTLSINDNNGCSASGVYGQLVSAYKPNAEFLGSPLVTCQSELEVNFYNNSTGEGNLTYTWDFGDGESSTEENPVHFYDSNDFYDVQLITEDEMNCKDTLIRQSYVEMSGVNSAFDVERDTVCREETIVFENLSEYAYSCEWSFGDGTTSTAFSPTHSYSEAGDYEVVLVAEHLYSCKDTFRMTINVESVKSDFSVSEDFSCSLPASVSYINNSENANSYLWLFGNGAFSNEVNPVIEYTSAGTFSDTLIAISEHGCVDTLVVDSSFSVTIPRAYFTPNIYTDPRSTKGCAPLTVNFENRSGYNTPHDEIKSFHWTFGDGESSLEEDPSHTFTDVGTFLTECYVETEMGCTSSPFYVEIRTGTEQNADFYKESSDTVCATEEIQFVDISEDTTLINEWYWSFGDEKFSSKQNPTHQYVDTGAMEVVLQVFYNGCMAYEQKQGYVYIKGPILDIKTEKACDKPYDITFLTNELGAENVNWDFGDGSGIISQHNEITHTFPENKDYTVLVTAENSDMTCSFSQELIVGVRDIKADFSLDNDIGCTGMKINVNTRGMCQDEVMFFDQGAMGKYRWDFDDGTSLITLDPDTSHIYMQSGKHDITLTVQDMYGCQDKMTKRVRVFQPDPEFSVDSTEGCMPMTVSLNNESESDTTILDYQWVFGDGTNSTEVSPDHTYTAFGMYDVSLTVTDALGCINSIQKEEFIKVLNPIPEFYVNDNVICMGDLSEFTPIDTSEIVNYHWDFGDGTSSDEAFPTHAYEYAGVYDVSLSVLDLHGCDSTIFKTSLVDIKDFPEPQFESSVNSSECYPAHITFSDTTNANTTIDWYWEFGDGQTSSHLQNPEHIYTTPGKFDVSLSLTNENQCVGTLNKSEYIDIQGPYATINAPDTVCRNEEAVFIAENRSDVYELEWIFGDGYNSPEDTAYHAYDRIGYINPVLLLKSDDFGTCDIFITDTLYIPALTPTINSLNGTFSGCEPYTLQVSNTCDDADSRMWELNQGVFSTSSEAFYTINDAGVYTLGLTLYNDFGCSDSAELLVEVFSLPEIEAMEDTLLCRGESVVLSASGGESYSWTPDTYLEQPEANFPTGFPENTINYYVQGTDSNGCINQDFVNIRVQQKPEVYLTDTTIIIGESVIFNVPDSGIKSYSWFPDYQIDCTSCDSVTVQPLETTTYDVSVTDTSSCFTETFSAFVNVRREYSIDVPTAFTPNNDGVNDIIFVKGWGMDRLVNFTIYNRYGEIVYRSTDKNEGWDGTYGGKAQPVGTYIFKASVMTYDGDVLHKNGTIKLLK
ncbi:MAG: PKD domain-containing protein [Bacteroidota bacterium]|nr:PKD domain-containing protein [Bacteroidota bacterium]